jgi:hypothetical protein
MRSGGVAATPLAATGGSRCRAFQERLRGTSDSDVFGGGGLMRLELACSVLRSRVVLLAEPRLGARHPAARHPAARAGPPGPCRACAALRRAEVVHRPLHRLKASHPVAPALCPRCAPNASDVVGAQGFEPWTR